MRIRFLKDAIYETEGPGKGPRFAAGSEHDMREDLARRWINRSLAEEIKTEPAAPAPVPAPAAAPQRPRRPAKAPDVQAPAETASGGDAEPV